MNIKINIILLLVFLLVGCKKNINTEKSPEETNNQQVSKIKETIIPVHTILFDTITPITSSANILAITKKIQPDFTAYPFGENSNKLNETKKGYKSKSFLKMLSNSFKNDNFLDVKSNHFSFLVPSHDKEADYISIQEWFFNDSKKAKSCFESLKTYKEREIYFKRINWIWVYQENKIYLVFARNLNVKDPEMQTIKNAIIETVSTFGNYETLQFYE